MKKILFIVYGIFITFVVGYAVFASKTFDGAIEHSYEKGLAYPEKLARIQALNWQFEWENSDFYTHSPSALDLLIKTPEGTPVSGATVTMEITRPAGLETLPVFQTTEDEKGHYKGEVTFPGYGHWLVKVNVSHLQEQMEYQFRIYVNQGAI